MQSASRVRQYGYGCGCTRRLNSAASISIRLKANQRMATNDYDYAAAAHSKAAELSSNHVAAASCSTAHLGSHLSAECELRVDHLMLAVVVQVAGSPLGYGDGCSNYDYSTASAAYSRAAHLGSLHLLAVEGEPAQPVCLVEIGACLDHHWHLARQEGGRA